MNKVAIVTGGSRGIGLAIAQRLGKEGYNIAVLATGDREKYAGSLEAIEATGAKVFYCKGSLDQPADRKRLVEETVATFGRIDLLVNNAGVAPSQRSDLLDMTEESFDRVIGVNTKGTLFLTQLVAKQMLAQDVLGKKRGTIINVSSCSAVVSSVNRGEYCVSKAGVSMLTTLFADRLAADGIFVHEVRPGVIQTDMTSTVTEKYDRLFAAGEFPIARWGTAEDVAGAVAVFAGDDLTYTTGNYLDIDGGFHIRRL